MTAPSDKDLSPRTRAVHHGTRRSQYGEMAEAIFLTQGFVYDSAEQAEGSIRLRGHGKRGQFRHIRRLMRRSGGCAADLSMAGRCDPAPHWA